MISIFMIITGIEGGEGKIFGTQGGGRDFS
jgi:hypothetical protein